MGIIIKSLKYFIYLQIEAFNHEFFRWPKRMEYWKKALSIIIFFCIGLILMDMIACGDLPDKNTASSFMFYI
ncbi:MULTISPECIES: hypothetical protein [Methanobrevibacter]|uniref:Uncharacterized protein n=1 Tax=Methanobrevibacter gottschalkii DSM 11977 TaxID=1122229 RepID=A0A3N5B5Z3_9EURY|nr:MULTISPECIES: hypothetical protein [Methanobrevibacter]OEC93915.1 hypothetical protein A9505_01020 [Methanobrevibacter sp. A27]RPF52753.1 hypothetical protein EDC42_0309 [Methanobrevibacter gottschalkii DSM 11977]